MTTKTAATSPSEPPTQIDGRYAVKRQLGKGGLAVVYQVHDALLATDRALKLLLPHVNEAGQRRNVELFEREFHTLAQFAHPRAVAVYDYGIDGDQPYYTMDLLDGGDLYEQAPLDWRRACVVARDVCSALSLLHSRRLVYRDMSPRNVRCTSDGQAKLIDFGAVTPMGPSKQFVGTAAFCAPEAVELQALDARTDLYSLGATLYFTLTGRRPYAARDFQHLRELWRSPALRPSELVSGIPEALDELVMGLLQLDPALRPGSAAEVMERLGGIAGLAIDEHLLVSQAYLTTPVLVGREAQLTHVHEAMAHAMRARGGAVLIRSGPGMGRSRLLDACSLTAKLAGAVVLRGDAEDAQFGQYGVVRALGLQLLERLPELALAAAAANVGTLGHVLPELLARTPGAALTQFAEQNELRPAIQAALREWLQQVAREKPLLLAIDDVQRIDEPSAATMALLARSANRNSLLIVAASELDIGRSQALALLTDASFVFELSSLDAHESKALLASVFGDVPNLELVSERLHALALGNPRDLMRLAQHLVDKRLIRYEAGAWSLPQHIDHNDLPSSMAQALACTIEALSAEARSLAQTLALTSGRNFNFEECLILCGHLPAGRLIQIQDELMSAEVIKLRAGHCELAQQRWISVLCAGIDREREGQLHGRLAEAFDKRNDKIRLTQHLLRSDQIERGLEVLLEHARVSQERTDPNSDAFVELVESLPPDWMACYEEAIACCERLERPHADAFHLRSRMAGLVAVTGTHDTQQLSLLLAQLERDSGLTTYAALDPALDPAVRLQLGFELTQQRYQATSERDRVLDPFTAIRQLARALIQVSAVTVTTRNMAFFRSTPSLAPYVTISPALLVVHQMQQAVAARCNGRSEEARWLYLAILERTSQADRAGLDESHHRHGTFGVKYSLGLLEAAMGLASSLGWAEQIESNPLYQVNAWTIRMLHHLWQGETRDAERCRRKAEVLRVQNSRGQFFEGSHVPLELAAHAAAGDLMRVKQCIASIEPRAQKYPGWLPILRYAVGEYHRVRGDSARALAELSASIDATPPVGHEMWAYAAHGVIKTLSKLGRYTQAIDSGTQYLAALQAAGLAHESYLLNSALAWPYAKVDNHAEAVARADHAITGFNAHGTTGLCLAMAYAARAQIARFAEHTDDMKRYADLSAAAFGPGANPKIVAKYGGSSKTHVPGDMGQQADAMSSVRIAFKQCRTLQERARCCLEHVAQSSGVSAGFLYGARVGESVALLAQLGSDAAPLELERVAYELLARDDSDEQETKTQLGSALEASIADASRLLSTVVAARGERYCAVLLPFFCDTGRVSSVAFLVAKRDQGFIYPTRAADELYQASLDVSEAVVSDQRVPSTSN